MLCAGQPGVLTWIPAHRLVLFQVIELLMTCTLYLVVSTSLLSDSLSGLAVPGSACSLFSLMFLLPCLLLTDLRPVSTLSLLCSLAHILIRCWSPLTNSSVMRDSNRQVVLSARTRFNGLIMFCLRQRQRKV